MTIILIAHDIRLVMNVCDRIQVLNFGVLIAEGDAEQVRHNPDVVAAYLGKARGSRRDGDGAGAGEPAAVLDA